MPDIRQILSRIDAVDPSASELLLPLAYEELRKLAAAKLVHEQTGQTLQAPAVQDYQTVDVTLTPILIHSEG